MKCLTFLLVRSQFIPGKFLLKIGQYGLGKFSTPFRMNPVFSFQNEWKETDGQPNLMRLPALRMGKKINPLPTLKGDFPFHVCTPNFFLQRHAL